MVPEEIETSPVHGEVQDGDKAPHRDASVWRRPSRLGALDSIILLPLRIEM